jgi:hypothetical protein
MFGGNTGSHETRLKFEPATPRIQVTGVVALASFLGTKNKIQI